MSSTPAGWYTDPSGRFEKRYWDGARWTEHVVTGGVQSVDGPQEPVAATGAYPETGYIGVQQAIFATGGAGAGAGGSGITGFLDRVGPDAVDRPEPMLRSALAGLGGLVLAFGFLVRLLPDDDPRVIAGILGAAFVIVGAGLRLAAPIQALKSAGTGIGLVGIPTLVIAITVSDAENGWLPSLALAVAFALAWALPGYRGRTLYLGIGALFLLSAIGVLVGGDSKVEECNRYIEEGDFDSFDEECQDLYSDPTAFILPPEVVTSAGDAGYVYLVGGAAYLGATWWLDKKRYRGAGTAFAAAGVFASFLGTALLVGDYGDYGAPLFTTVVGAVVCVVGAHGGRRATSWLGALLTSIGVIWFVVTAMKPENDDDISVAVILSGLALVGIALAVEPIQRSLATRSSAPSDGSDAPPS